MLAVMQRDVRVHQEQLILVVSVWDCLCWCAFVVANGGRCTSRW